MIASPHDLTYFVELTHTLNFSRASERIGISQPSLSAAIKRLEHSIGAELFVRSKNGVTLTHAGKQLLSHTKQLLQLWDNVKAESLASHREAQGSFSLGCHPSVGLYLLPKFLPMLFEKYPKLEIHLKHDISRKITEGVIDLSIDVGIVINPVRHPDLIIQKLYNDKTTCWIASDKQYPSQNIHAENPVIICDPELLQAQWLLKQLQKAGIKNYRLVTTSSLEVIAKLTAFGAGIGILPASVAMSAYPKKLKSISNMASYEDEACLIYRPENRDIKAIQIIATAIKKCKSLPQ